MPSAGASLADDEVTCAVGKMHVVLPESYFVLRTSYFLVFSKMQGTYIKVYIIYILYIPLIIIHKLFTNYSLLNPFLLL